MVRESGKGENFHGEYRRPGQWILRFGRFQRVRGCTRRLLLGHEQLAFLIVGLGCFLMLAGLVTVLVLMNNRENDRDTRARDRDSA